MLLAYLSRPYRDVYDICIIAEVITPNVRTFLGVVAGPPVPQNGYSNQSGRNPGAGFN